MNRAISGRAWNRIVLGSMRLFVVAAMLATVVGVWTPVQDIQWAEAAPVTAPVVVAADMVGSSDTNLINFTNNAPAFSSSGDGFGKFQRGVSPSIPYALLDDSLVTYPADVLGIIDDNNTDEFFGATDTINGDNSGPVTAVWLFNISGATGGLTEISINMGAMGDFELADYFVWTATIDGGAPTTVFQSSVNEAGSANYTLAGGYSTTLNDPMSANGTQLSNVLQTITAPLTGTGALLTLTLEAATDGGSEAFAFQDIQVMGNLGIDIAWDMVGSTSNNLNSFTNNAPAFSSSGDGFGKFQRGVSPLIPYALLDDSLVTYSADTQGIIDDNNTHEFFGATDTINNDNSGPVTAVWEFDISSATNGLTAVVINMGAMGDFELADYFVWTAAIDAGAPTTIFQSSVDEAGSADYTLAGGYSTTLNDPMSANGTQLSNVLQTIVAPLSGTGTTLTLTLEVVTDGGSEAFAFQDIVIVARDALINAPILPTCPASIKALSGVAATTAISAIDVDGVVNNVTIQAVTPSDPGTFSVGSVAPASASGGTLTATLDVGATTPLGAYVVTLQFSNTDAQTMTCNVAVDVAGLDLISGIQGAGSSVTSPGSMASVAAIVVGDYQENGELRGFFIQEETTDEDGDPATSEGIFVYCGTACATTPVSEGDRVLVIGEQAEYFGMSQLDATATGGTVTVLNAGAGLGLVTPASIDLPVPATYASVDDYYEMFEGMLVQFADTMTVTEYYELARFGHILLSQGGRLRQYTQDGTLPLNATDFAAHMDDVARRSIFLDDLNNIQNDPLYNSQPVYHPQPGFSVSNYVRGGAIISNLTGVLHWSWPGFGSNTWRIRPQITNPVTFANPPRPFSAPAVGGNVRVASLNVLNYFNGDGLGGGFPTSRGAHSQAEFDRQTEKLVLALAEMDADAVGLMEIENDADGPNSSINDLVDALNAQVGAGTYEAVLSGVDGTDEIKVGLIYKSGVLRAVGAPQVLDDLSFTDPLNTGTPKNRPALAQTFRVLSGPDQDAVFTVVVVHLKSKGSSCGAGDDDATTGQGNCNGTRTAAATVLANWLATDPTNTLGIEGAVDSDFLIIGDFNAYYQEDPMQAFYNAGYNNLSPQSDFSYVFSGEWGALDHAIASATMTTQVAGTAHWHINADESSLLDYNDTIQDTGEASYEPKPDATTLYASDVFRNSDHDPVVIGLDLLQPVVQPGAAGGGDTGVGAGSGGAAGTDSVAPITSLPATGYPQPESSQTQPMHVIALAGLALIAVVVAGGWTLRRLTR